MLKKDLKLFSIESLRVSLLAGMLLFMRILSLSNIPAIILLLILLPNLLHIQIHYFWY